MAKTIYLIFIALIFSKFCNAQDTLSKIEFGAYLDGYFTYDFSKPTNHQRQYTTQYDQHNTFAINHAWISGSYKGESVRSVIALQLGSFPLRNQGGEPEVYQQLIYKAYAGLRITKNSWLDFGVFEGHFGYESALSIDRALLSPALSTEYTPYYQTGIRYGHELGDKTKITFVLLNGWQSIAETNDQKSFGMAISHQLMPWLNLSYGNYFGNESTDSNDQNRSHHNFVAQINPIEKLELAIQADFTNQKNAVDDQELQTSMFTFVSSYRFTDKWSIAGRYENASDKDGLLIEGVVGPIKMSVVSLALNYSPAENTSLKMEVKTYKDELRNFVGDKGSGTGAFVLSGGLAHRLGQ
ncbi:MAG: hypothetical protein ACI83W_002357 [Marinoscillum sp.]|jgi:hypothetical protein